MAILKALENTFSSDVQFSLLENMERIPPFNPDRDDLENPLRSVKEFRDAIINADGLVIASPEYAHAISGLLKNALDWVVRSGELVNKPTVVINVSPTHLGAEKAHEALKYTIRLLSGDLIEEGSFRLGSGNRKFNAKGEVTDGETKALLEKAAKSLVKAVRGRCSTEETQLQQV